MTCLVKYPFPFALLAATLFQMFALKADEVSQKPTPFAVAEADIKAFESDLEIFIKHAKITDSSSQIDIFAKAINKHFHYKYLRVLSPEDRERFMKNILPVDLYEQYLQSAYKDLDEHPEYPKVAFNILGKLLRRHSDAEKIKPYLFSDNYTLQVSASQSLSYMGVKGTTSLVNSFIFNPHTHYTTEYSLLYCLYASDYSLFRKTALDYLTDPKSNPSVKKLVLPWLKDDPQFMFPVNMIIKDMVANQEEVVKKVKNNESGYIEYYDRIFEIAFENWDQLGYKKQMLEMTQQLYTVPEESFHIYTTFLLMEHGSDEVKKEVTAFFTESEEATESQKKFFHNQFMLKMDSTQPRINP